MPNFPSLAALNDWLEARCRELWAQTPHGSQPGAIADVWLEEAQHLMRLVRPFDRFVEYAKRVSPTCLIYLERNRYSVLASFANRPVSMRVKATQKLRLFHRKLLLGQNVFLAQLREALNRLYDVLSRE